MFKIFKCNSRLLQDMVTIFLDVDSIANRWRHKKLELLRLEQLLRIFRALQTSRVLHISMKARWNMNQLLNKTQLMMFYMTTNGTSILTIENICFPHLIWKMSYQKPYFREKILHCCVWDGDFRFYGRSFERNLTYSVWGNTGVLLVYLQVSVEVYKRLQALDIIIRFPKLDIHIKGLAILKKSLSVV